ncbi:hypothetical protein [uncultured Pontibacter sp.]|uniref:hypothetical protein n=1 Tax=uncultured Pontibacter sp. TaxID=453356 RepID=UPI00260A2C20|nr:hypothetical protein [uncultured Pontibacter sp.]
MKGIEKAPFKYSALGNLSKVGDLVYFLDPMLTLIRSDIYPILIFDWSESDIDYERWIVYEVSATNLNNYLDRHFTHLELIHHIKDKTIYVVDYPRSDAGTVNCFKTETKFIPKEYLPKLHVEHDDDECPDIEEIRAYINNLVKEEKEKRIQLWQRKFPALSEAGKLEIAIHAGDIINKQSRLLQLEI